MVKVTNSDKQLGEDSAKTAFAGPDRAISPEEADSAIKKVAQENEVVTPKTVPIPEPAAGIESEVPFPEPPQAGSAVLGVAERKGKVGEIVLLNLAMGVRPAIILSINPTGAVDLCVFFNGPKDYTLTGNTEVGTWYTEVVRGNAEGQWNFRN